MTKQRLDTRLVDLQLCTSRQQAQRTIRAGEVRVNQRVIDKPGTEIDLAAVIEVKTKPPFVSRGGEKLAHALAQFAIVARERIALDGGISTGGFTDCLLQAGVRKVYGVDVGYGQVAWKLRQDARVKLLERTNFRYLTRDLLYEGSPPADLGVMDLSFISLTKVLSTLSELLAPPREVVLLVKPQFEVGRSRVGKNGVVRDPEDRAVAIHKVIESATAIGWHYRGVVSSPIRGPAGNIEYLLWLREDWGHSPPSLQELVALTDSENTR